MITKGIFTFGEGCDPPIRDWIGSMPFVDFEFCRCGGCGGEGSATGVFGVHLCLHSRQFLTAAVHTVEIRIKMFRQYFHESKLQFY